jgi:hypothetical protein
MKTFSEDEIYLVSIIANLILSAVKLRKRFAPTDRELLDSRLPGARIKLHFNKRGRSLICPSSPSAYW